MIYCHNFICETFRDSNILIGNKYDKKYCEDDNDVSMNALTFCMNEFDIHFDPSQNNNKFQCTECDFQYKYSDIFNEHMKTHTGEN